MKTTVDIPASLVERHGEPVGSKLRAVSYKGEGVQPSAYLERWDQLGDLIYQGPRRVIAVSVAFLVYLALRHVG